MSEENKVFGIDLGTTYSAIAHIDEVGKARIIKNADGEDTTPSVVLAESETNHPVGISAKDTAPMEPEKVISFIKRKMDNAKAIINIDGREYTPVQISAYILKKLAKDAEEDLKIPVKDVVITCPAYFGTVQRENTKAAGEAAGLNVLSILDEPVAAALSYSINRDEEQNILVYDLGGGTFDVTAIQIKPKSINVVCTGGDAKLGGKDWDDVIIEHIIDVWKEETGESADILNDKEYIADYQELVLNVEKAKKLLTSKEKTALKFAPNALEPLRKYELTREKFEEITKFKLDRTIDLTKKMLEDASEKMGVEFIPNKILLVGGSSRMLQVKERLTQEFGEKYNLVPELTDPDQAVAKGAAIWAKIRQKISLAKEENAESSMLGESSSKDLPMLGGLKEEVVFSLSKSYGTKVVKRNSSGRLEEYIYNMLLFQQAISGKNPATYSEVFRTVDDNQSNIAIEIVENEVGLWKEDGSAKRDCDISLSKEIAQGILKLPPNVPKGTEVYVSFEATVDCIIRVKAECVGEICEIEVKSDLILNKDDIKEISNAIMISDV